MKKLLTLLSLAGSLATVPAAAQQDTSKSLRARIEALQVPDVAWRQIPWKSCFLDGLNESRRSKRPLMLWIFIDRPIDDTRC